MADITVKCTGPGEFRVYNDGADTGIFIWNGSLGFSGRNAGNTYGIQYKHSQTPPVWCGSLASAKKLGIVWARKLAEG